MYICGSNNFQNNTRWKQPNKETHQILWEDCLLELSTNKEYCVLKTKTQALGTIETKNKKTSFYYKRVLTFLPWLSPLLYSIPTRIEGFPQLGHVKSSVVTYLGYNYHPIVISSNKHFSKGKWKKRKDKPNMEL